MGQEIQRLKKRKKVIRKINFLSEQGENTLVIHYSCESFYNKTDGKTSRITSIAVRNLESGQTDSFSIHQIAEEQKISFTEISDKYDILEKEMLDRFFDFVKSRLYHSWIHWNMRDVNYGFAAIEHRYRVLGGEPTSIPENKKFDLSRAFGDLYGVNYIEHPGLESIIQKNNITDKDFLTGQQEAEAFDNKEFVRLHQSTLRKVNALAKLFEMASYKSLKTNSSWTEQYGFTPSVFIELIKESWVVKLLIIGGGVLAFITRLFDLVKIFN
ncbi:MAG: hypothetical protein AAGA60_04120 [Cyanobacteria bacterium P01_E01_bin.42]